MCQQLKPSNMSAFNDRGFDPKGSADAISQAPGPSPWYYGQELRFHSDAGPLIWKELPRGGYVALVDAHGICRLALGYYSYSMRISGSRILVWYETGEPSEPATGVELALFEIADLSPLEKITIEARVPRAQALKVIFNGGLVASVRFQPQ
jgi:hypothetical protein